MLRRTTLMLAGAAVMAAGAVHAQTRITPDSTPRLPPQPGQGLPVEDLRALQRAALFCEVQAEAGQIGVQKASTPVVRQLAESIAADHERFRQTIAAIATERRLALPNRAAARIQDASLDALRQASGESFDRTFISRQLGLRRPMAELFQTMASNSPDPALQRLGITVLAAVQAHFEAARQLGAPMGLRAETVESPPQY